MPPSKTEFDTPALIRKWMSLQLSSSWGLSVLFHSLYPALLAQFHRSLNPLIFGRRCEGGHFWLDWERFFHF